MSLRCPACGSREYESRWQGSTYELRCSRCHAHGVATTRFSPFSADKGPYAIRVTSLGPEPARILVALNRRYTHGIRRTRELFAAGEHVLLTGDALAVWKEAQQLLSEHIPFRIEPNYPYNLATFDPRHAHEHDWSPVLPSDL